MKKCIRCWIAGRVQGVWFRASTRDQAERLGVSGYARNLRDGRVEVLACGEEEAVEGLRRWLGQGPPMAIVDERRCEPAQGPGPAGFSVE